MSLKKELRKIDPNKLIAAFDSIDALHMPIDPSASSTRRTLNIEGLVETCPAFLMLSAHIHRTEFIVERDRGAFSLGIMMAGLALQELIKIQEFEDTTE